MSPLPLATISGGEGVCEEKNDLIISIYNHISENGDMTLGWQKQGNYYAFRGRGGQ